MNQLFIFKRPSQNKIETAYFLFSYYGKIIKQEIAILPNKF